MIDYNQIRTDLNTKGWTLVNTKSFFLVSPFKPIKKKQADRYHNQQDFYLANVFEYPEYEKFIVELLEKALPDEKLHFDCFDKRYHVPSIENHKFAHWHKDHGYIRTMCRISGASTEFKHNDKILKIPLKYTLIFTGLSRTKIEATTHRTPSNIKSPRKLIVGTFRSK